MAARSTKLTAATIKRLCYAIEQGMTYELACKYAGIVFQTLRNWQMAAETPHATPLHHKLVEGIEKAEATAVERWLTALNVAAQEGSVDAAKFMLERRYPHAYGKTVQEQEHSGGIEVRVAYVNDWRGGMADGATALPGLEGLTLPNPVGDAAESEAD